MAMILVIDDNEDVCIYGRQQTKKMIIENESMQTLLVQCSVCDGYVESVDEDNKCYLCKIKNPAHKNKQ